MICPGCGYEQPAGDVCSQCQTPFAPAFKESPPVEEKEISSVPSPPQAIADTPRPKSEKEPSSPGPETVPPKKEPVRERFQQLEQMVVTTTPVVEGRQILAYLGIVTATVLIKGDLFRDFLQSVTGDVVSTRLSSVEESFERARTVALTDLKVQAAKRGANAVVGLSVSQASGAGGHWIHLAGTAVTLKE